MKKGTLIFLCILAVATFLTWSTDGFAYQRYIDGCNGCHGNFTQTTVDQHGSTWPSNLHEVHRNSMLNGICGACHLGSPSSSNAYTNKSTGSASLPGYGCSGCHGNNYNGAILGAGLRAHHRNSGADSCGATSCHSGDPTPKPENKKPPYYGRAGVNVKDPLNKDGSENWSNDNQGLDNDGNLLYDQNDPAAQTMSVITPAAGEAVPSGAPYSVTWTAKAGAASYKVTLSVDGGLTWSPVASGVTGTGTSWNVPGTFKKNTNALIKVKAVDAGNNSLGAAKSGAFTIDVVTITLPAAGEIVTKGSVYNVTWTTNGTKGVPASSVVSYSFDGGVTWKTALGSGTASSFSWNVPTPSKAKNNTKLKVVLKDAGGAVVGKATSKAFKVQ